MQEKKSDQYVRNAAGGWLYQIVAIAAGALLLPYMIRRLGARDYGVFLLATSSLAFFSLVQRGFAPTLVRAFSAAIAAGDRKRLHGISSSAHLLLGLFGGILALAAVGVLLLFPVIYDLPAGQENATIGLLACLLVNALLNLPALIAQSLVHASNRYELANLIEIGRVLLNALLLILLFELLQPSLLLLGLASVTAQLARLLALQLAAHRLAQTSLWVSIRQASRKDMRQLFGFSIINLINAFAAALVYQGPILIVGKVLGESMVTALAPALLITGAIKSFMLHLNRPLIPLASSCRQDRDDEALGHWALRLGCWSAFVGWGLALPWVLFGRELVQLWLGPNQAWTWPIVAILCIGTALAHTQSANFHLALGGGNIRPAVASQILLAIVVCAGTLLGTTCLGWNLTATTVFIALATGLRNTFYLTPVYARQFGYRVPAFLLTVYLKPILLFAGCVALGWYLRAIWPSSHIIALLCIGLLVGLAYLGVGFRFLALRNASHRLAPSPGRPVGWRPRVARALLPIRRVLVSSFVRITLPRQLRTLLGDRCFMRLAEWDPILRATGFSVIITDELCRRNDVAAGCRIMEHNIRRMLTSAQARAREVVVLLQSFRPGPKRLADCLQDALNALEPHAIRPFLAFGTLLGLVRRQGFLENDNDVDLGIFTDEANSATVRGLLEAAGFKTVFFEGPEWPCRVKCMHPNGVSLDVVFFHRRDGFLLTYMNYLNHLLVRRRAPFELDRVAFGNHTVWIPHQPERFLTENYGNWTEPVAFYHCVLSSCLTDYSQPIVLYCARRTFYRLLTAGQITQATALLALVRSRCPADPFWVSVADSWPPRNAP